MSKSPDATVEPRRGTAVEEEAYLRLVGERVRLERVRRGMSRKLLSQASGVSERYLAELERGSGNASLLVLRQIAEAMSLRVSDLASEDAERSIDLQLTIRLLERLAPGDVVEARRLLHSRFGRTIDSSRQRVALIGLRGSGKASLARDAAKALHVPFIELDREIEKASGMELPEIFSVHGQAVYHKLERECLQAVIDRHARAVITTGGGLVNSPENFELLLASCFVVWIKASPRSHVERATKEGHLSTSSRVARPALAELSAILESRTPLYAKADASIDTTGKAPSAILSELMEKIAVPLGKVGT
jgi:XRE family aerobic/anaerobic benzoate catabolism transcriptional regulator